jgi:hypothetical protein
MVSRQKEDVVMLAARHPQRRIGRAESLKGILPAAMFSIPRPKPRCSDVLGRHSLLCVCNGLLSEDRFLPLRSGSKLSSATPGNLLV